MTGYQLGNDTKHKPTPLIYGFNELTKKWPKPAKVHKYRVGFRSDFWIAGNFATLAMMHKGPLFHFSSKNNTWTQNIYKLRVCFW